VLRYVTAPDGGHHVVARGLRRFRVLSSSTAGRSRSFASSTSTIPIAPIRDRRAGARPQERALETLQLLPQVPAEMSVALQGIDDPAQLANVISSVLDVPPEEKQSLLETFDLKSRLDRLLAIVARRIEVLKVSRDVADRTRESIGDVNRKHLLREQMRTIQKELGEGDEGAAEIEELDKAIDEAHMPDEVEKVARKELKRLERMPEAAGEYSMVRTYLDWLVELPWGDEPEPRSTSPRRAASSTRTTSASTRSSAASSSTWRCTSSTRRARARSCASSARPASARPRSARASPRRPGASSRASAWAASTTRPRSAATAAPTSARCPATSSRT
jgi:ATP-dependent Lon protease